MVDTRLYVGTHSLKYVYTVVYVTICVCREGCSLVLGHAQRVEGTIDVRGPVRTRTRHVRMRVGCLQ